MPERDPVMRTYWPPSRPWRYSLDFHRQESPKWGVTFYEASEPVSEQRWALEPAAVTTKALREWLESVTAPDAARAMVEGVFASRPFFFVDQQH
ncbi:MAG TPA: hypothetical protein VMU65_06665 [Candidatus Saccharimonadales bacterium]|nr:hypothetical protein [Candidatus Saccharimonadales bacterium]